MVSVFDAVKDAGHSGNAPAPDESDSKGELLPASTVAALMAIRQRLCDIARDIGEFPDDVIQDRIWVLVEDLAIITAKPIVVQDGEA